MQQRHRPPKGGFFRVVTVERAPGITRWIKRLRVGSARGEPSFIAGISGLELAQISAHRRGGGYCRGLRVGRPAGVGGGDGVGSGLDLDGPGSSERSGRLLDRPGRLVFRSWLTDRTVNAYRTPPHPAA